MLESADSTLSNLEDFLEKILALESVSRRRKQYKISFSWFLVEVETREIW